MVSRVLFRARQLLDGGWGESRGDHFSARRVAAPGRESAAAPSRSGLPVPIGRTSRELCDLARGGVYPAPIVTDRAVRSYRTISPLPDPGVGPAIGGVFSVALSLARDRSAAAPCSGRWALPTTVSCRARTFLPGGTPPERSPHPQRRTMIGEAVFIRTGAGIRRVGNRIFVMPAQAQAGNQSRWATWRFWRRGQEWATIDASLDARPRLRWGRRFAGMTTNTRSPCVGRPLRRTFRRAALLLPIRIDHLGARSDPCTCESQRH